MALLCLVCTTHTDSIVRSLIHQNFGLQECCERKSTISSVGTRPYESKKNTLSLLMYSADQCTPRSFDV